MREPSIDAIRAALLEAGWPAETVNDRIVPEAGHNNFRVIYAKTTAGEWVLPELPGWPEAVDRAFSLFEAAREQMLEASPLLKELGQKLGQAASSAATKREPGASGL